MALDSFTVFTPLQWRHNGHDSVSNHRPHDCLFNRLFRRRSKKTSKLRVTGLCAGNSSGAGEVPAQMASNAENAYIWWRHHVYNSANRWLMFDTVYSNINFYEAWNKKYKLAKQTIHIIQKYKHYLWTCFIRRYELYNVYRITSVNSC